MGVKKLDVILSIIIAVHNNQNTLSRCIDSFYKNVKNMDEVEIICINDHSTDQSLKIISSYKKIKTYSSLMHGLSASRNCGIKNSRGRFIWFIDADDELCGNNINMDFIEQLKYSNSELFLLGVEKKAIKGKNKYLINKANGTYNFHKDCKEIRRLFKDNIINNSWNKLYKREIIINNDLFFDNVSSVEDILFNCKYLAVVNQITTISKLLYIYYIYSKTSTKWSWQEDKLSVSVNMLKKVEHLKRFSYSVNNGVVSSIATDTLIGNEINTFISEDNKTMNFRCYKNKFNSGEMKFIRQYSSLIYSSSFSYFVKSCIANSSLLSYLYVKKITSDRY